MWAVSNLLKLCELLLKLRELGIAVSVGHLHSTRLGIAIITGLLSVGILYVGPPLCGFPSLRWARKNSCSYRVIVMTTMLPVATSIQYHIEELENPKNIGKRF